MAHLLPIEAGAPETGQALRLLSDRSSGEGGLRQAIDMLEGALGQGCALAAHQLAVLAAVGVLAPPDWDRGLDLLARSAELGSDFSRAQLRLLSGEMDARDGWPAVARAVDMGGWLKPPAKQIVCESPRLRAIGGFAPGEVCDWLMARGEGRLRPAQTYSETGEARLEQGRTNTETDFTIAETDMVMVMLRARISAAMGLPTAVFELTKLLHYSPGERFNRHFDYLDPAVAGHAAEIAARGQRIATFLLYLNDDYEGGETDFPMAGVRHRGGRGDGFFFANVDPHGAPDRATLHQGLPPASGEKWLLSQWIRNRPQ
jgi:prolyl 4-hydroxylase